MAAAVKTRLDRLHELKTVHADFAIIARLAGDGYRFDDADAPAVREQLRKAVRLLGEEIDRLEAEWRADPKAALMTKPRAPTK